MEKRIFRTLLGGILVCLLAILPAEQVWATGTILAGGVLPDGAETENAAGTQEATEGTDTEDGTADTDGTENGAADPANQNTAASSASSLQYRQAATITYVEGTIPGGVTIGGVDVSGLTAREAEEKLQQEVTETCGYLLSVNLGHTSKSITAADLGLYWSNNEVVNTAVKVADTGNAIARYKTKKKLENTGVELPITYALDEDITRNTLVNKCEPACNRDPVEPSMTINNGVLETVDGDLGYTLDVEASEEAIREFLTTEWGGDSAVVNTVYETAEPTHTTEELSTITDLLGEASTDYSSSGDSRKTNIANAVSKVTGRILYPGDSFSMLDTITPFTEENGYELAHSYSNGTITDSFGGGICQVSTTLYLSILRAELQVDKRYNHSMKVTYVKPSMDAAIAEESGKDFQFTNNLDYPVFVYMYADGSTVYSAIYGTEYRDPNRTVEYESVVLDTEEPGVTLKATNDQAGYVEQTQSAHEGCSAELYKIVKVNGEEVSREQVNSSTYNKSDTVYSVGVSSSNSALVSALQSAIGDNSINEVWSALSSYGY